MSANYQSWHIATPRESSFKTIPIFFAYDSHKSQIIITTLNHLKALVQIVIYNIVIFHYYPRVNSQGPTRNRSQNTKLWQSGGKPILGALGLFHIFHPKTSIISSLGPICIQFLHQFHNFTSSNHQFITNNLIFPFFKINPTLVNYN